MKTHKDTERPSSRLPAYRRIYSLLAERVREGTYPQGHYLPSERALSQEFKVSRGTIRQAISTLQDAGLVEICPTRGILVKPAVKEASAAQHSLHTGIVALVTPWNTGNVCFAFPTISGTREVLDRHGLDLLLYDTFNFSVIQQLRRERAALKNLLSRRVSGALVWYQGEEWNLDLLRRIQQEGIPLVLIDREVPGFPCDAAVLNNEEAGYLATCHLIDQGHQRIAHITSPFDISSVKERQAGYKRALSEHGIPFDEHLLHCHSEDNFASASAAVNAFLSLEKPPTAIFAISDEIAFFVWEVLEKAGLRVPEDIALVGVNNTGAERTSPDGKVYRLTTIDQPFKSITIAGAELLCKRTKEGAASQPEVIRFPAHLVVRDSSQPEVGDRKIHRPADAPARHLAGMSAAFR